VPTCTGSGLYAQSAGTWKQQESCHGWVTCTRIIRSASCWRAGMQENDIIVVTATPRLLKMLRKSVTRKLLYRNAYQRWVGEATWWYPVLRYLPSTRPLTEQCHPDGSIRASCHTVMRTGGGWVKRLDGILFWDTGHRLDHWLNVGIQRTRQSKIV
jgi:hypothetical protein